MSTAVTVKVEDVASEIAWPSLRHWYVKLLVVAVPAVAVTEKVAFFVLSCVTATGPVITGSAAYRTYTTP